LKKINYVKLTLDLLMALTFALLFNPRVFNGLTFHETSGIAIGAAILAHIGMNSRWVKNSTLKIFDQKLPGKVRFSYFLNLLLLITMATVIITGVLISRVLFPNISMGDNHSIRQLHSLSSYITLLILGVHVGVHWNWVMNMWKKLFKISSGKRVKGILVTGAAVIVLLSGVYALNSIFTGGDQRQIAFQRDGQQAGFSQPAASPDSNFSANQFNTGEVNGNFQGRDGGFGNRFGHRGDFVRHGRGVNPIGVIINYLGILGIITALTYYQEKSIFRRKKNEEFQKISKASL
jgi:hypothetical protein